MKRVIAYLVLSFALGITGCCIDRPTDSDTPELPSPAVNIQPEGIVDVVQRPLELIPVGTVIGKTPPAGWSHLVLFATSTLTAQDERDAPKIAAYYAQLFKFTLLTNVVRRGPPGKESYYLEQVARGFATDVGGQNKVIDSKHTLGASMGMFGRRILKENEQCIDTDVRQVVRSRNMLIFDAQSVMRRNGEHVKMIMRHALLVDPTNGRLYTLVWLMTRDYEPAENALQLLPDNMWEKRWLSVRRDKFDLLGIPTKDAFALRQVPQGKAVPYTTALREAATVRTFTATNAAQVENILRNAAVQAAGR
jgi:hypothetical protein